MGQQLFHIPVQIINNHHERLHFQTCQDDHVDVIFDSLMLVRDTKIAVYIFLP